MEKLVLLVGERRGLKSSQAKLNVSFFFINQMSQGSELEVPRVILSRIATEVRATVTGSAQHGRVGGGHATQQCLSSRQSIHYGARN